MKNTVKNSKAILFFALITIASISNSFANNNDTSVTNDLKAQVNYLGATAEGVLFNIAYANENGKKFTVKITNDAGDVLYVSSFKGKKFVQKFQAPKDLDAKLTFEIVSEKQSFHQTFNIQQKVFNEVVV